MTEIIENLDHDIFLMGDDIVEPSPEIHRSEDEYEKYLQSYAYDEEEKLIDLGYREYIGTRREIEEDEKKQEEYENECIELARIQEYQETIRNREIDPDISEVRYSPMNLN